LNTNHNQLEFSELLALSIANDIDGGDG